LRGEHDSKVDRHTEDDSEVSGICHYDFARNDPCDRSAPIQLVLPAVMESRAFMASIRSFVTPPNAIAVWYLGQNGFILKDEAGTLIAIDLYLTNSCAAIFANLPFRLDRQLPIFIEPEDLDVDFFVTTHSHMDHTDPETIRRMKKTGKTEFVGPYDSIRVFHECGVDQSICRLIHPGQQLKLETVSAMATFALPTDNTDLNHTGILFTFENGLRFYNTGDTAYAERLSALLPKEVDVCAICINGGFHNLGPMQAATIVKHIRPRTVIPCHYDMMVNNVGSPDMLQVALNLVGSNATLHKMKYYSPSVFFAESE
jgi:L-ascorbate 6-phosphate lactonase